MFAKKLSCSTKPVENVTTSNDYQYSNFDLNRQRILCNDLISFVSSPPMAFNKKRNCYGNVANDCHKESKLDLNWKNKGTKAKTFMNGALGDKNGEKRWKNEKDSSLKKSSTLSIHIKAYENAIEASIVIEEKLAEAKAKKDSWKSIAKRVLPDSLADDSFEYPRQQTDKISEPQIMQFTASQTLFNPNASVGTSSSNVTPAASQREDYTLVRWNGSRFQRVTLGPHNRLHFIFEEVAFDESDNLDPLSLEFNSGLLQAVYLDGEKEVIKALRLTEFDLEIFTSAGYKGPYSQLGFLVNNDSGERLQNPTNQAVFAFLSSYNFIPVDQVASDADVVPRKTRARKGSRKPVGPKPPKQQKIVEVSNTEIERGTLVSFHNRLLREHSALPDPTIIPLPLGLLEPDITIRSLSQSNVDVLYEQMAGGQWQSSLCTFTVHKQPEGDKYAILNGNHRFTAMMKHNASAETSARILTVNCKVYSNLNLNQILLVNAPVFTPLPHAPLTVLQKLRLGRMVLQGNGLPLSMASKKDEDLYRPVMEMYFSKDYPDACTQLLKLPESLLDDLFDIVCGDVPLEQLDISPDFWKVFSCAAKKNSKGAVELLPLLNEKPISEITKLLKKLDVDLLAFMSERGSHEYTTEQAAIADLTGGKDVSKDTVLKYFRAINLDHNKDRNKGNYDWNLIGVKLQEYIRKNSVYPNALYISTIADPQLLDMDLLVSQNSTAAFLSKLEVCCKKAVLILLGNFGEGAPTLPQSSPIAVFDILVQKPVLITKDVTSIPQTGIKASLYLPGAPKDGNQDAKMKFLSKRAIEKRVSLGKIMALEDSHVLANFTDSYNNAAICNVSEKIAKHFLSTLTFFSNIFVTGGEELKTLVAATVKSSKKVSKENEEEENAEDSSMNADE